MVARSYVLRSVSGGFFCALIESESSKKIPPNRRESLPFVNYGLPTSNSTHPIILWHSPKTVHGARNDSLSDECMASSHKSMPF